MRRQLPRCSLSGSVIHKPAILPLVSHFLSSSSSSLSFPILSSLVSTIARSPILPPPICCRRSSSQLHEQHAALPASTTDNNPHLLPALARIHSARAQGRCACSVIQMPTTTQLPQNGKGPSSGSAGDYSALSRFPLVAGRRPAIFRFRLLGGVVRSDNCAKDGGPAELPIRWNEGCVR